MPTFLLCATFIAPAFSVLVGSYFITRNRNRPRRHY